MSTVVNSEPAQSSVRNPEQLAQATRQVRTTMAACRVQFQWLGTRKSLTPEQKTLAASSFDAQGDSISAGKKLIDTTHPAWRELSKIKSKITAHWKALTLPYPEPGLRLIRHNAIDSFHEQMIRYRQRLEQAVRVLGEHYGEIRSAARQKLGSLFDSTDYPGTLLDEFHVTWDFPAVEPPDYLRQLNPELYQEQAQLVSQRFERAVELAEQAFMEELDRLVNHLADRLAGSDDGKAKIFRDSAVENLNEFFSRFRQLNVSSNQQLDELVVRCEQVVRGVQPQTLRDNDSLRRNLATQLSSVQSNLDQLMVDRPRRNILRSSRTTPPAPETN